MINKRGNFTMVITRLSILLLIVLCPFFIACSKKLDSSSLPTNTQFVMSNNLMCTIVAASDRKEIGNKIALLNLMEGQPKVKYESGNTSPMQKVFESETTLTIQLVASASGSVDTFVIDKKKGHFSRAVAGSLLGVYSDAAIGTCK